MTAVGSVHGRFQIFHNDHARYVRDAFSHFEFIYVGLTGCRALVPQNAVENGRLATERNPLNYWERLGMIGEFLEAEKIPRSRFQFIPFPIEQPELLDYYLPKSAICATTVREDWNAEKIEVLKAHGFQVVVLYEDRQKLLSSTQIRSLIAKCDPLWKTLVPASVVDYLETNGITKRIASQINRSENQG